MVTKKVGGYSKTATYIIIRSCTFTPLLQRGKTPGKSPPDLVPELPSRAFKGHDVSNAAICTFSVNMADPCNVCICLLHTRAYKYLDSCSVNC